MAPVCMEDVGDFYLCFGSVAAPFSRRGGNYVVRSLRLPEDVVSNDLLAERPMVKRAYEGPGNAPEPFAFAARRPIRLQVGGLGSYPFLGMPTRPSPLFGC